MNPPALRAVKQRSKLKFRSFVFVSGLCLLRADAGHADAKHSIFTASLSPSIVWQRLQAADKAVSQGKVVYSEQKVRGNQTEDSDESLIYASDSRFSRDVTLYGGNVPRRRTLRVFDGEDEFYKLGNYVSIHAGRPFDLGLASRFIELSPGPCLVMGRGLSTLRNHKITLAGTQATVMGTAQDNSQVRAVIDTRHDCLARLIERRDIKGRLVGRTTTTGLVKSGQGSIAAQAQHAILVGPEITIRYRLVSAAFRRPDDSALRFPLQGRLLINDERLGGSIVSRKTSPGTLDKAALLQRTRAELEKRARIQSTMRLAGQIQLWSNGLLLLLPALLLGAVYQWRVGRREKAPHGKA